MVDIRERFAKRIFKEQAGYLIGGLENCLLDFEEDSEIYRQCQKELEDKETLIGMTIIEGTNVAKMYGRQDINFLGNKKIREIAAWAVEWHLTH